METPERLARVAERAARAGGDYLREAFREGDRDAEYGTDDVTAAADRAAERRVLDVVEGAFHDHAIHAEESGRRSGDRYEWVVDPLDGTNNFVAGYPVFATSVAVRDGDETVAAAVHRPITGTLYRAVRGAGATADGTPLSARTSRSLEHGTVALVVGLDAVRDDEARARTAGDALRDECRRVVRTWAPSVDWSLLAAGGIDAVAAFRPEPFEHHAGTLLAAESGAAGGWLDDGEWYVAAGSDETRRSVVETLPR